MLSSHMKLEASVILRHLLDTLLQNPSKEPHPWHVGSGRAKERNFLEGYRKDEDKPSYSDARGVNPTSLQNFPDACFQQQDFNDDLR